MSIIFNHRSRSPGVIISLQTALIFTPQVRISVAIVNAGWSFQISAMSKFTSCTNSWILSSISSWEISWSLCVPNFSTQKDAMADPTTMAVFIFSKEISFERAIWPINPPAKYHRHLWDQILLPGEAPGQKTPAVCETTMHHARPF